VFPATFATRPRIVVLNNGATKGGAAEAFAVLHQIQGVGDVWQLHRSARKGARNFADDRIANLDETTGYWIKVSASEDGSFSVANARTRSAKRYPVNASRRTGSR
jgi:hypothetical protein